MCFTGVMEEAIIVDEHDQVVEYRKRAELHESDRFRITVVWIEDGKGNALIHLRSNQKKYLPGLWENAAGGGVAKGESYETNAYKELAEEIGVRDVPLQFVAKKRIKTPHGERFCAWYKVILDWPIEKFVLEPREVAEIRWVPKQQLFDDRDAHPEKYMPSSAYWRELFED
jgi:isopentenyldiphosphate isomerase